MQFHLYRSKTDPTKAVTVGVRENSSLFLSGAAFLSDEDNSFDNIAEIEALLGDTLELIIQKQ